MYVVMLILHILVSLILMVVVLLQSGKGRGLAGAFGGGGGNQTLFGGRGAVDFLGKATWVLGGAFMLTSLTLAVLTSARSVSGVGGKGLIPKTTSSAPTFPPPGSTPGSPPGSAPAPVEGGGAGTTPPAVPGGN
jgi:preprotein translocase subunit SecG